MFKNIFMLLNEAFYKYIYEHKDDNTNVLRLQQRENKEFDVSFAIDQIEARKKIKSKLPHWHHNNYLLFPSVISTEQASSEETAIYKSELILNKEAIKLCDLTGGLGIDTYYFAQKASSVTYIERYPLYCEIAQHNYKILKANNITIINDDCNNFAIKNSQYFNICYIDPARRGKNNKRVFAFEDCEPDILSLLPNLYRFSNQIIIKASPMVDITSAINQLSNIAEIHIVSVKNECKELLFILQKDVLCVSNPQIICVNICSKNKEVFSFSYLQERTLPHSNYASFILTYLYEPNSSILKSGAFKTLGQVFCIDKLHVNSHLYTSDKYIEDFPGRKFKVIDIYDFSSKNSKIIAQKYTKASISSRNFPLRPDELKKRLKIKDGEAYYLFATTLYPNKKVIIITQKVQ